MASYADHLTIIEHIRLVEEIERQIDVSQKQMEDAKDKGDDEQTHYYRGEFVALTRALNMLVNGVNPKEKASYIFRGY